MSLLRDTLAFDTMREAWEEVAENQGGAGTDDETIRVWNRNWEERIRDLSARVAQNRYKPGRLRKVLIPKRDPSEYRILMIPTVTDRVIQKAASIVITKQVNSRFFPFSFGYRPGLGVKQAVEHILVIRENGCRLCFSGDIDDFFNNVDHELLLRFIDADLSDNSLVPLVSLWLEKYAQVTKRSCGIPQGSPVSPILANIYLHRLDYFIHQSGLQMVRYADDFVILFKDERSASRICTLVTTGLSNLLLRLAKEKSFTSSFDAGFTFLGVRFQGDEYSYNWKDKRISSKGTQADWLFSDFGPDY